MSARSSERRRGLLGRLRDECGSVVVLVAVGMVVLLGGAAFALEFGRTYLGIMRLSRAVDAGVLAAARTMRLGHDDAAARAVAIAAANGVVDGEDGVSLSVSFEENAQGQMTAVVTATRALPMALGRLFGREELSLSSSAAAASPPVDLMMVIDQSFSLSRHGAWDDLQDAATDFVDLFGAGYDQLGLVSFHTRAVTRNRLSTNFSRGVKRSIDRMSSTGYTNMAEGLREAQAELEGPRVQPGSLKAVVFFTDGWPNTMRVDTLGIDLIAATGTHAGVPDSDEILVWLEPDDLPEDWSTWHDFSCDNRRECLGYWPQRLVDEARAEALRRAEELREEGVYVYTIGMKDPTSNVDPDMGFLRRMANEDGVEDAGQPQAKAYYAPSSEDLEEIFTRVASDLMVHLVR